MRTILTNSPAEHIVLVGTGEAALAALWRLCAAGARIRWYVDSADIGEEAVLAHALGGGRVELSFGDPPTASLDGAAAIVIADQRDRHARLAERARTSGVAVHSVGAAERSAIAAAGLVHAARRRAAVAAA